MCPLAEAENVVGLYLKGYKIGQFVHVDGEWRLTSNLFNLGVVGMTIDECNTLTEFLRVAIYTGSCLPDPPLAFDPTPGAYNWVRLKRP